MCENKVKENINNKRKEIDKIDLEILRLLNARAHLSLDIRKEKQKISQQIYDSKREEQIIDVLYQNNKGPLFDENIRSIFLNIIKTIRELPNAK